MFTRNFSFIFNKNFHFLFIVVLCLFTYLNILPNKLFYDDEELIYKNFFVKDLRYLPQYFSTNMIAGAGKNSNMYRPILILSFAIDNLVWNGNPFGFHLTSIILHAVNGILLYLLILFLFKNKLLSLLTSFFFILHPVQTEAVAYASGRTDPLYVFFALVSILLFLISIKIKVNFIWFYLLSVIFFILSLLSKESAFIIPFLILLIIFTKKINTRFTIFEEIFLVSIYITIDGIYFLLRLTYLNFSNTLNFYSYQNIYSQNLLVRLLTFTKVFFTYLGMIFYPNNLVSARTTEIISSVINPWVFAFLIITTTFFTLSLIIYKKNRVYLFSFFWFFITILPVSGVIPINNILADHYLYLPSISFFLLISFLFIIVFRKLINRYAKVLWFIFLTAIYLSLLGRTYLRNLDWRDPITFYNISLKQSPNHIPMRNNLAMAYDEIGNHKKAIEEYKIIVNNNDIYPNTHHNLGISYIATGQYKEAEEEFKKALKMDPQFYFSLFALEELYKKTQDNKNLEEIRQKIKEIQK